MSCRAAVCWPRSHPGATQPVRDSGAIGPCQNSSAAHLLSINASHSLHLLRPPPTSSFSPGGLFLLCHRSRPCTVLPCWWVFFFSSWFCPSKQWFFSYSCPSQPHASSPPLYLVPTEKFLTHYILNWKPAECGGCELGATRRSSSKPPTLTPSAIPMPQYYHYLNEIS